MPRYQTRRRFIPPSIVMAVLARHNIPIGITLFGIVSSLCFLLPGIKYHRQRIRGQE